VGIEGVDEMSSEVRGQGAAAATVGGFSPVNAVERAVVAVFDGTSKAWADGDANAFTEWYAEDATVILPGFYLRDQAEVRAGMGAAFAGPLKGSKRIHVVQSVRFLDGDAAVVITRSATTFQASPRLRPTSGSPRRGRSPGMTAGG
jgi:uncharacterized protein (TIGR02246 family)